MRDFSTLFLDLLRNREIEVSLEPISGPKSLTLEIVKNGPLDSAYYLEQLNILADLFVVAGVQNFDCALYSQKLEDTITLTFSCDVYNQFNSNSVYLRLERALALYSVCRLFIKARSMVLAKVSTHALFPNLEMRGEEPIIRYSTIVEGLSSNPVIDIVLDSSNYLIADRMILVNWCDSHQLHCFAYKGEQYVLARVFLNEDYPCVGHPELVQGIGMYHCGACGDMQLAGSLHLPRPMKDES